MVEVIKRFDNLTDEEVEEGMVDENKIKSKQQKLKIIIVAVLLISILFIGYEVAPLAIPHGGEYFLDWLMG